MSVSFYQLLRLKTLESILMSCFFSYSTTFHQQLSGRLSGIQAHSTEALYLTNTPKVWSSFSWSPWLLELELSCLHSKQQECRRERRMVSSLPFLGGILKVLTLILVSHWLKCSHMATSGYKGV